MIRVNKIKGLMTEHGLTITDLATKLNMAPQTLSFKLSGKSTFNADEMYLLIEILKIEDPVDIFFAPADTQ